MVKDWYQTSIKHNGRGELSGRGVSVGVQAGALLWGQQCLEGQSGVQHGSCLTMEVSAVEGETLTWD